MSVNRQNVSFLSIFGKSVSAEFCSKWRGEFVRVGFYYSYSVSQHFSCCTFKFPIRARLILGVVVVFVRLSTGHYLLGPSWHFISLNLPSVLRITPEVYTCSVHWDFFMPNLEVLGEMLLFSHCLCGSVNVIPVLQCSLSKLSASTGFKGP